MPETFRSELEKLINRFSMENGSNTPDFMLADYLNGSLKLFDSIVREREGWYGRKIVAPGDRTPPPPEGCT